MQSVICAAAAVLVLLGSDRSVGAADKKKWEIANGTSLFTHEMPAENSKPDSIAWKDAVGKSIVVQGIAWGGFEKGLGPYVIMNRSVLYVDSTRYPAVKLQGRPVELKGKLIVRNVPASKPGAQGYRRSLRVFLIQPTEYKILDRITWPWMQVGGTVERSRKRGRHRED